MNRRACLRLLAAAPVVAAAAPLENLDQWTTGPLELLEPEPLAFDEWQLREAVQLLERVNADIARALFVGNVDAAHPSSLLAFDCHGAARRDRGPSTT